MKNAIFSLIKGENVPCMYYFFKISLIPYFSQYFKENKYEKHHNYNKWYSLGECIYCLYGLIWLIDKSIKNRDSFRWQIGLSICMLN